jgi:uncharacterized protein DUF4389
MANQTSVPITDSKDVWIRGLFMLLFAIAFGIGQAVLNAIAIVQFLWLLFARETNGPLVRFGNSLSVWLGDVARFQTCATDVKPFPWRPWP